LASVNVAVPEPAVQFWDWPELLVTVQPVSGQPPLSTV
jgi:hypothetical protein